MMEYEIANCFYGENLTALQCRDAEMILAGAAETGKTLAMLTKLHWCAIKYPGAALAIMRKTQSSTYNTVLVAYKEKVLGDFPAKAYGGEKPEWFDYPNGSRIWVGGLDKASKILSGEFDILYVNQAEELSLPEWETLTTRTTGRAGHMPYSQCIGDANPASNTHWIITRRNAGYLSYFQSYHKDNPALYNQELHEWTEQGKRTLARLQKLSGARYKRLYQGLWAPPEGAIYDIFDEDRHMVKAFDPPALWPRFVGVDPFGAHIAALWLAFDPQNQILNVYREYHEPFGITTTGHARNVVELSKNETIFAWVGGGPSERQARTDWQAAGVPLLEPPISDVWAQIDRVYNLLKTFSLVIHDSCPILLDEIGAYRRKMRDGKPTEQIEDKSSFHVLDALRYIIAFLSQPQEEQSEIIYRPAAIR